ncbi:MAG: transketolase [Rhodospirillaceae bacterium TMED8]|nr:transketolase [Magnetovibrio sp.]OUT51522.1 MAG: transketolase [Rhodospirillaceae bacterium TMED8]
MTGASHQNMANAIRFLSADAVQQANSGHPGMPMGMADAATVLFTRFLKFDSSKPDWMDRDRFVLSAGHGSMLLYSLLYLTGYKDMTLDEIKNFRQIGAKTAGHPEYGHAAGIETTTGPLGQGLSTAVGMALAERMLNARFGDGLVDHYTYVIAGDGCLMEGVSHEAVSLAGYMGIAKLIILFDDNGICIDGQTDMTVGDDQLSRFKACGWDVKAINGHDPEAVTIAIEAAKLSKKPSLIACKTEIGHGSPTKAGTASTHGAPLGEEELQGAREKKGWPHGPFIIPEDILMAWRDAGTKHQADRIAWESRLKNDRNREEFERMISGTLPNGWMNAVNVHKKNCSKESVNWATRKASGEVLSVLTEVIPDLIGGAADLTGSVNTKTPSTCPIKPSNFSGRYLHYGVREHGMAGAMNGIALHGGFVPYAGTFLVFADYMKGAMRLSSLMEQRVIYVLTHDSIGLGEDGPTHQPVETLAMLRAQPNFNVFRPCDAVETSECWALALENKNRPSGMVLTRQNVPIQRIAHTEENLSAKGAYVLLEGEGGQRRVTLMATGSEVQLAVSARESLQAEGIPTAVISMPCWELFDKQDSSYQDSILGQGTIRVGVEAGVRMGWDAYIGPKGGFIGMSSFGASGPASALFKHFGITCENIITAVKDRI